MQICPITKTLTDPFPKEIEKSVIMLQNISDSTANSVPTSYSHGQSDSHDTGQSCGHAQHAQTHTGTVTHHEVAHRPDIPQHHPCIQGVASRQQGRRRVHYTWIGRITSILKYKLHLGKVNKSRTVYIWPPINSCHITESDIFLRWTSISLSIATIEYSYLR